MQQYQGWGEMSVGQQKQAAALATAHLCRAGEKVRQVRWRAPTHPPPSELLSVFGSLPFNLEWLIMAAMCTATTVPLSSAPPCMRRQIRAAATVMRYDHPMPR